MQAFVNELAVKSISAYGNQNSYNNLTYLKDQLTRK